MPQHGSPFDRVSHHPAPFAIKLTETLAANPLSCQTQDALGQMKRSTGKRPVNDLDGRGQGTSHLRNAMFSAGSLVLSTPWVPVAASRHLIARWEWLVEDCQDLFSRRVVGWSMKAERDATLVMDALMMAVWRRGKADALPHHSDQGSQYTSEQFQRLLADNGITCSMSRAGNVWDNSAMESFFSSLKIERTNRKVYRTRDEARADVFDYIERFYNPRRRHSKLGYLSPMEFEARAMLA